MKPNSTSKIIHQAGNYGIIVIILGLIWFMLNHFLGIPDYFLPRMSQVWNSLLQNHTLLLADFSYSFFEAVAGLVIAGSLAFFLGLLCYFAPFLLRILNPLVLISQALPMLALAPLIILWLGLGLAAKLTVIVLALFFPIFATFIEGLNHLNPLLLDIAHTLRATKLRLFRFMVLPSVFPYLASGIKISVTWSILSAIVAEWVGGSEGLGFLMQNALSRLDTPLLFAALILLVAGTLIFYGIINRLMALFFSA